MYRTSNALRHQVGPREASTRSIRAKADFLKVTLGEPQLLYSAPFVNSTTTADVPGQCFAAATASSVVHALNAYALLVSLVCASTSTTSTTMCMVFLVPTGTSTASASQVRANPVVFRYGPWTARGSAQQPLAESAPDTTARTAAGTTRGSALSSPPPYSAPGFVTP
jgi:hypothetical protein